MEAYQYEALKNIGAPVFTAAEVLKEYGHDETEDLNFPPNLVIKPSTPEEISQILTYCNQEKIPVTPAGARTGLSGGSLPIRGGVLLSMEKFNRILKIDTDNLQVTTEPGVITEELQNAVDRKSVV